MQFRQAARGHFFVREPFQGYGGFGASEADVQAVTDAIVDGRAAQADFINAVNALNSRCGGPSNLDSSLMTRLQQLTASDQQAEIALNAAVDSYLKTGSPSVQNIVDMVNGRIQAINAMYPDIISATCVPSGDTVTAEPWTLTTGGGGTTGGGYTTGGGSAGGGTTGGGGGGMVIPPPVEAGFGWWWLIGGGLLAAMMFFSKNPPKLVAILGRKKTTRRKATRRTTTRRAAPRRRASRRRW
jgi:hypothetical protein